MSFHFRTRSGRFLSLAVLAPLSTLLLLLCVSTPDARGVDRRLLFRVSNWHYVVRPDKSTSINWTGGFATAKATVRLPRIVFDSSAPGFGTPGTVMSVSTARAQAREEAREKASLKLLRLLGTMRLDSNFSLLERMRLDNELRNRMGNVTERFLVKSRRTGEGKVSVELAMPFYTEGGLYALLAGANYSREAIPRLGELEVEDQITGLIVDLTGVKEFHPSLEVRIYSDQGRRIYGPEVVRRDCTIRRGIVRHYFSLEQARQDPSLGIAPFYTVAAGSLGRGKSDIYLDSADVRRILSVPSGRRALRRCAVALVLRKPPRAK